MKKLILAAVAASLVSVPALAAPPQHRGATMVRHAPERTAVFNRNVYKAPNHRQWRNGERFDHRYARNYRVVNDWRSYRGRHLYAPPRGYHWVQSGNDAVLVGLASGVIGAVLAGVFN